MGADCRHNHEDTKTPRTHNGIAYNGMDRLFEIGVTMMSSILRSVIDSRSWGAWILVACVAGGFAAPSSSSAAEIADSTLTNAMDSTVFLRVDRLFSGRKVSTSGTGFFIHRDGWILTNEHVISDKMLIPVGGTIQDGRSKVLGVVAVVNSGTPDEAELDAKIIARSADADLALLKIAGTYPAILDVWREVDAAVTDQVWVVGYPFGELLAIERWQSTELANPVVSVNQGRVSALRRGPGGELRMIQTDAAVNPGNSGGPMISEDGTALGVVTAKVGTDGIGFAVSSGRVRDFILSKGYTVQFQPTVIVDSTRTLVVRLESGLINLEAMAGEFGVGGGQTPDTSASLKWNGYALEARVDLPPSSPADAAEGLLRGRIELSRETGQPVSRVFRLRGKTSERRSDRSASRGSTTSAAGGTTEIDNSATLQPLGLGGGKFSGARASGGGGEPGVMISDELMAEIQEYKFTEERYAELPFQGRRSLAEQYDRTSYEFYRAIVRFDHRDRYDRRTTTKLREELDGLLDQLAKMQTHLREYEMCRCGSKWKQCSNETCYDGEKPWVEDDLGEIRRAIKSN